MATERKLNGREYRFEKLLASDAIKLQVRLMKFLGPALNKLPQIIGKDAQPGAGVSALAEIIMLADPDETLRLIKDVVSTTKIKTPSGYNDINIDLDFSERIEDLYEIVVWVLKEQYASFFSGRLGNGSQLRPVSP